MKKLFLLTLCFGTLIAHQVSAQAQKNRLEAEVDPIAFLLSGYSFHAGYMVGHIRFDAGAYGIKQPSSFVSNDRFSVFSSGIGIKADYFLRENRGLFIGLQSDYVANEITLKSTGAFDKTDDVTIGLRGGYRFAFGSGDNKYKGFYLVPWLALIYSPNASKVRLETETYKESFWSVFPTVHVGYRF